MGRQVVSDQQAGFSSGLNSVSDPAFLRPDQARQMANLRLSNYGAALKRLGTQLTTAAALSTFDTTGSIYGGIYWPTRDKIYAIGGSSGSAALQLWETTYPTNFPATWIAQSAVTQTRPVIFTDGVNPEVMYLAGDNRALVQKASPRTNTIVPADRSAGAAFSGTSVGWSQISGAGANSVLVAFLRSEVGGATSVVWDAGGTPHPLTKFASITASGVTAELWYLVSPPVATKTVTASFASSGRISGTSATYYNVNQSSPFDSASPRTATGAIGTQPSVQLPTTAMEWVVDVAASAVVSDVLAPGGGQTLIRGTNGLGAGDIAGGIATTTVSYTGVTDAWVHAAGALQPTTPGPDTGVTTLPSTTASVKGLVVYNDRLWGWSGFGTPNALYFSQLSSVEGSIGGDSLGDVSTGGGEIIVRTFGISDIVVCAPVGSSLLIFHERGVSRLTGFGQDDISIAPQPLTADVGMASATQDGLCVYANVAYFVTDRGMYRATESAVGPLATPDKPDPTAALLTSGTVNPSQFIVRFNRTFNEVWVSIDGVGIYIYNVILDAWSGPFTGTYASGTRAIFEVVNSASGNSHLWRTTWRNASGMFVSECDRAACYTDDVTSAGSAGSVIPMTLQLHRMFAGDRIYAKSWRWVNLQATLTAGSTPPVMTTTTQIGGTNTHTLSGITSLEQTYYVSPGGVGPYLDVTITDSGSTGPSSYAIATAQGNMLGQR